jgi:hypothetical protein
VAGASNQTSRRNRSRFLASVAHDRSIPRLFRRRSATLDATLIARNHVKMRVGDGLSRSLTDIDADVVAVWCTVRLDVPPNGCHQCPNRGRLLGC